MGIKITYVKEREHLVANFTGSGGLLEIGVRLALLARRCRREKRSRLLIDITRVNEVPTVSQRFQAGKRAAVFAEYGIRVAVMCSPEQVEPRRLVELVAQNRGVDVRVFTDLSAAQGWLLE